MIVRALVILLALLLGTVVAAAQTAEADVVAAAEAALAEAWPALAEHAEVRVVRLSPAVEAAEVPIRVRFLSGPPRGRTSAAVEVQTGPEAWERVGWAFLEVAHFGEVAVLTRDVARGEPLAGAVRIERREATGLRNAVAPEAVDEGWTAARTLRAGTVLTAHLANAPAAVERGDRVAVTYARDAVHITLVGEARQRGALGDEVRVHVDEIRSTFRVRLTGPGTGEWVATL